MNMKIVAGIIGIAVILTGTAVGVQTGLQQRDNNEFVATSNGEYCQDGNFTAVEDGMSMKFVDKGVPPGDILPYVSPFVDLPLIEYPGFDEPYPLPDVYFISRDDIIWITPLD